MFPLENTAEFGPSTNTMGEVSPFFPTQMVNDSNETENEERCALDLQLSKHEMEFSPLLRSEVILSHDDRNTLEFNEDFTDPGDCEGLSSEALQARNLNLAQSVVGPEQITELASSSLLERRGNPLSEEMKTSWRLRLDEVVDSSSRCSPVRFPQSISNLSPVRTPSPSTVDDSRIYAISDNVTNYRRSPLRPRRLSQSPTLPSIPERLPSVDEHEGDSDDAESSLGIYEHWADAYLVDNTSEEQSVTSPTYHSAYGGNDDDYEEEGASEDDERDNFSFSSYPCKCKNISSSNNQY